MDMKKYSGEHFFKVADVPDGALRMQIAGVREGRFEKPDLIFTSGDVLSLNATNNQALVRAYGRDSDGWIEKEIELSLGEIEYQGRMRPAVLVRPISPAITAKEKIAAAKKFGDDDPNDQVPF
jgi:hypothetical protein